MLGAVMFGHQQLPAGDRGDHRARRALPPRSRWPLPEPPEAPRPWPPSSKAAHARPSWPRPMPRPQKQARQTKVGAVKAEAKTLFAGNEEALAAVRRSRSATSRPTSCAAPSSTPASASTAATPRPSGRSSAEVGVLPRAHGSALFTRGETQALVRGHARHRPGRADHRRARGRVPRALHAALQLPALLGRRGRPHGLARPARDRPRQARLARDPSAAAGQGEVPLHDPRRVGDHRVATAPRRWRRSAAARCR